MERRSASVFKMHFHPVRFSLSKIGGNETHSSFQMTVCLQMSAEDFMDEDRGVRNQGLVFCSLIVK